MHQSKLIRVLKKLTCEEFKNFKKFLQTPLIKNKPKIGDSYKLFLALEPHYPRFTKEKIQKEGVFNKIYPKSPFKSGKLEKQMTHLFALLEAFVIEIQKGQRNELSHLLLLGHFYQDKGLNGLAKITHQKYRKVLSQSNRSDSDHYYDTFLLEKQLSNHQARILDSKQSLRFLDAFKNLDHYYLTERLELTCRLIAINRFIFPVDFGDSMRILDQLKPLLEDDFYQPPVIRLFYRAIKLLTTEGHAAEPIYLDFEQQLQACEKDIPHLQLVPLQAIIRNYCVSQYVKGNQQFLSRTFNIYKKHLEQGYLYQDGRIYAATLINMVEMGLLMDQADWVYQLIHTHEDRIMGLTNPQEDVNLSWAHYYFYIDNYDKTLDYLNESFEDNYTKIKAKRMELKVYYEMKHVLLAPKIDAFKIFVYRISTRKVTEKYKTGNRNFIDVLKQICLPKTYKNTKRIDKLTAKIKSFRYIHEKDWLFAKLESLR